MYTDPYFIHFGKHKISTKNDLLSNTNVKLASPDDKKLVEFIRHSTRHDSNIIWYIRTQGACV